MVMSLTFLPLLATTQAMSGAQRQLVMEEEHADRNPVQESVAIATFHHGAGASLPAASRPVGLDLDSYGNILDNVSNSKASKESSAIKHFKLYLTKHRKCTTLPELLPFSSINSDLIGGFMKYLGEDAHAYLDDTNDLLSYETASGYASSVKGYFVSRFRDHGTPPVMQAESWKQLRLELSKIFVNRHKKKGTPMSSPRECSTDEDRDSISVVGLWDGSSQAAEFMFLNVSMFSASGRGSEVAGTRKSHLKHQMYNEEYIRYPRINLYIQRSKNAKEQDLGMYIHRVSSVP